MQSHSFFPAWSALDWKLVLFPALLLLGFSAGELLSRLRLPRLTGYILIGMILGDSGLGLIDESLRDEMGVFINVGLGLLLFELGQRLDLQWMRRERWLWLTSMAEIALTGWLSFTAMRLFGFPIMESSLLASVAVCTSPVIVMGLVRELAADGPVTDRVVSLAAINSIASFLALTILLGGAGLQYAGGIRNVVLHPLYLIAGSFALGWVVFISFRFIARFIGKSSMPQHAVAMSMILLAVGAAVALKLSVLGTLLTLGILAKNADPERRIRHIDFGVGVEFFFVILFISEGASITLGISSGILLPALVLIGVRYLGKSIPIYLLSGFAPLGIARAGFVSLAMIPLSGLAALLVLDTRQDYPQLRPEMLAVIFTAIGILELAGPVLASFALRRAKENRPES